MRRERISDVLLSNIVALSESPVKEGLIYVGTDEGWYKVRRTRALDEI